MTPHALRREGALALTLGGCSVARDAAYARHREGAPVLTLGAAGLPSALAPLSFRHSFATRLLSTPACLRACARACRGVQGATLGHQGLSPEGHALRMEAFARDAYVQATGECPRGGGGGSGSGSPAKAANLLPQVAQGGRDSIGRRWGV